MFNNILDKLPATYKRYNIKKIKSGASKKVFYKLFDELNSHILIDFILDNNEYNNHIKIYNILQKIDISIPKIIEKNDKNLIIISEDFGKLRFDKILHKEELKKLLLYAIDTLIIINKSIKFDKQIKIQQYSSKQFKAEILELPEYYFPFIGLYNEEIVKEFLYIWTDAFKKKKINFESFVHKDYNMNNLILLPNRKNHLKCGIIDFQSAFWGNSAWDLFSLLEDSRLLFSDEFNEYLVEYYYSKTNQPISINEFKSIYHFLNCSRQTRLLGRWVKLAKEYNQKWYLNFIPITKQRLKKSIVLTNNKNLINFYDKYII